MEQPKKYFLSHSSGDKGTVTAVAEHLGRDHCWLDQWDMEPGDELFETIDLGIESVEKFIIFWSKDAAASPWVREELAQTRFRKLKEGGVRRSNSDIKLTLAIYTHLDTEDLRSTLEVVPALNVAQG